MSDEVREVGGAIATVLQAANIDTTGLVVPDVDEIDRIEDDTECALVADRAFRALHVATGRAWIVMGGYAEIVHRRKLWEKLQNPATGTAFSSFKDWCENASEKGRTTVYGEMTLLRELQIPREDLVDISKANCFTLLKVKRRAGASKITPELIGHAKTMKDEVFAKHCRNLLPGAAADELQNTIKFSVPESCAELFRETVQMLQVLGATNNWEEIIEVMCIAARDADFEDAKGNLASLKGLSNWEAFSRIQETLQATGTELKSSGKKMKGARIVQSQPEEVPDAFDANTSAIVAGEDIKLEDDLNVPMVEDVVTGVDAVLDSLSMEDGDDWDVPEVSDEANSVEAETISFKDIQGVVSKTDIEWTVDKDEDQAEDDDIPF